METKESSFIIKIFFVKFMKYPNLNPNHRNSIHRMNIGSISFCDFERFEFRFFLLERAYGNGKILYHIFYRSKCYFCPLNIKLQ